MALKKFLRGDMWYLRGTVREQPVYVSTGTSDEEAAEAIRILTEKRLLDESIFGKEAVYIFPDAVVSYLEFATRSDDTKATVKKLLGHFKSTKLRDIGQVAADNMCRVLVPSGSAHVKKNLLVILNAILEHAAKRHMCARPLLEKPKTPEAATPFLYPAEATKLARAAPLHLRPLIVVLISVGCRPEEALALDWRTVDLKGGQAILTLGKVNKVQWTVTLRPAALRALKALPHREGRVFRTWLTAEERAGGPIGPGYRGGRITTGWETACAAAQLPGEWVEWVARDGTTKRRFDPLHDPYCMRHSFCTWHRCVYKDLGDLRDEIGWTTTRMGERYAKKMSRVYEPEILAFWNGEVDLGLAEVEEVSCRIRA